MNDSMKKLVLLTSTITVLAACSTAPKVENSALVQKPVADAGPTPVPVIKSAPEPVAILDPLDDPKSGLANRSIYFDFNKYNVKGEFDSLNSTHANYLASHVPSALTLQMVTVKAVKLTYSSQHNLKLPNRESSIKGASHPKSHQDTPPAPVETPQTLT